MWTALTFGRISTLLGQKEGEDQSLGRSQGGFGTKAPLRVEGTCKPVAFVLTTGHQHEARAFEQ